MDQLQQKIDQQSLYQVSNSTIAYKNFLAGFSRGLGAIAAQLIFFFFIYLVFFFIFYPRLAPMFKLLERSVTNIEKLQQTQSQLIGGEREEGQSGANSINVQDLLEQFQQGNTTR